MFACKHFLLLSLLKSAHLPVFFPGSFWGNIQIFDNWEMLEEGYYPDVFTKTEEPFSGRNSSVLWEVIPNLR